MASDRPMAAGCRSLRKGELIGPGLAGTGAARRRRSKSDDETRVACCWHAGAGGRPRCGRGRGKTAAVQGDGLSDRDQEIAELRPGGVQAAGRRQGNVAPDTVRKISSVLLAAGAWANRNRPQSAKILEKYSGVPVPPSSTRVTYAERIRPADVQPVLDMLLNYGVLKTPMRAGDLFASQIALSP